VERRKYPGTLTSLRDDETGLLMVWQAHTSVDAVAATMAVAPRGGCSKTRSARSRSWLLAKVVNRSRPGGRPVHPGLPWPGPTLVTQALTPSSPPPSSARSPRRNHDRHRAPRPGSPWRTSTYCDTAQCIRVARAGTAVAVRDSVGPATAHLAVSARAWAAFLSAVKAAPVITTSW
jgi:hypothetical protein